MFGKRTISLAGAALALILFLGFAPPRQDIAEPPSIAPEPAAPPLTVPVSHGRSAEETWQLAMSMRTAISPYEGFGLTVDDSGTLQFEGAPVREVSDPVTGALITERLSPDWPQGTIDVIAVYEKGVLTALRPATREEYDRRTEARRKDRSEAFVAEEAYSREQYEPGTKEDYDLILALMTPGFREMGVDAFRCTILDAGNADDRYYMAHERVAQDAAWGSMPSYLTAEQQHFITLTLAASGQENHAEHQTQLTGEARDPALTRMLHRSRSIILDNDREEWAFEFYAQYDLCWQVLDGNALTVKERDERLHAVTQQLQAFAASLGEETLLSEGAQAHFQAEADRLCAEASNSRVRLSVERLTYSAIGSDNLSR